MRECTDEVSQGCVNATVKVVITQRNGDVSWVFSVSNRPEVMVDIEPDIDSQPLTRQDLYQAQREDPAIGQLISYEQQNRFPARHERQGESHETRVLLRSWKQLKLGGDGIPRRRSGPNLQFVLPRKFHRNVYKELHEEMGHLGTERGIHVAREGQGPRSTGGCAGHMPPIFLKL